MAKEKKQGKIVKFFSDFKAFISKGNVMDMAVGVIIGGAFGKIVSSLVADIIMPLISLAVGGKSVEDMKIVISKATDTAAEAAIRYGAFLQTILDFLIIAFFIFLTLRIVMNLRMHITSLDSMADEFILERKEKRALTRKYLAEGHSRHDAKILAEKAEATLRADAEAAAAAAKLAQEQEAAQLAEAEAAKESLEDILKDIRTLLQSQTPKI